MRLVLITTFVGVAIAIIRTLNNARSGKRTQILPPQLTTVELPNLNEEWLDMRLPITDVSQLVPWHFRVTTLGLYKGKELGLTIEFKNIDPNLAFLSSPDIGHITATPEGVILISQGTPTHNLIELYASLAGKSTSSISVPSSIKLTAVTLEGNPQAIDKSKSKIKVFHRDDEPDGPYYFEMYINPDVPGGWIELGEKDPDYREPLLRSFGAQI